MLRIRNEQLIALAPFRRRICDLLLNRFQAAREISSQELFDFVEAQMERGNCYGLSTESQLAVYIVTAFVIGEDFDTRCEFAMTVLNSAAPPEDKANRLEESTKGLLSKIGAT